ncbi:MAG: methionyl-tRNA formyltransferase [Phycisphaerales bacterium]|nr:methionyl-tRNA formyltransferase [Phycisphaerales bacterium]
MDARLPLVFFGSGAFGVPSLRHLMAKHDVRLVVTQPDRPAGRGGKLTPTPIAELCQTEFPGVRVVKPEKVNEASVRDDIRAQGAAAFVVIAFGQKLGKALLDSVFSINLHGSILPRWRGAAPINAALLAGDPQVGNSVITLADKMDAGLVLATSSHPTNPDWTTAELHDILSADGPSLIERVLGEHVAGTLKPQTQDETLVTIAPKMSKADGWVDFEATADECRRRVHALNPWPGVTVQFRGEPLKLLRTKVLDHKHQQESGTLVDSTAGVVACGGGSVPAGSLQLIEVQPAGKRAMAWKDFAMGRQPKNGERLIGGKAPEGTVSC